MHACSRCERARECHAPFQRALLFRMVRSAPCLCACAARGRCRHPLCRMLSRSNSRCLFRCCPRFSLPPCCTALPSPAAAVTLLPCAAMLLTHCRLRRRSCPCVPSSCLVARRRIQSPLPRWLPHVSPPAWLASAAASAAAALPCCLLVPPPPLYPGAAPAHARLALAGPACSMPTSAASVSAHASLAAAVALRPKEPPDALLPWLQLAMWHSFALEPKFDSLTRQMFLGGGDVYRNTRVSMMHNSIDTWKEKNDERDHSSVLHGFLTFATFFTLI